MMLHRKDSVNILLKKYYVVLFVFFSLFNCNKNATENIDYLISEFPKQVNLSSEKLKIPSILLKMNDFLVVEDSLLIVYQKRRDTIFSIFNLKNELEHIHSFGSKGRGPNEFNLSFSSTFKHVYSKKNLSIAIGNKMTKIQYYKINELIEKNSIPYKKVSLPPKLNGFRAIVYVGDSLVFGAPYAGGGDNIDLFKYNCSNKKLDVFVEYPNDFPLMDMETKREVYGCYMTLKNDNSKFARVYSSEGKLEIFNVNNTNPYTISYEGFPKLKDNLRLDSSSKFPEFSPDQKVFSWGIASNNKYIYIQVFNDSYDKIAGEHGLLETCIPEIHVFDWDGKPIAKCKLDNNFIDFDVDSKGKYLYASSDFDSETIIRYDLSEIYSN